MEVEQIPGTGAGGSAEVPNLTGKVLAASELFEAKLQVETLGEKSGRAT